ncbi:MAG: ATP-binding cassette domain-containing protein, partial [Candidatus Binatia bacterium]
MTKDALSTADLRVRYADATGEALGGVTLVQRSGEMVGIVGATGAGKSTLLKCASRIVPEMQAADVTGTVEIFGESIVGRRVNELAGRIGILFQ